ncbi:unannotated protein [freshwater metagenome]|uniref:Unannotated protein n=1 Tax=freshwater metagenome TaxID=449393 RepID=A0A6J7QFU3_9ZZZZ
MNSAAQTPDNLRIEATDRSISEEMITKVIPTAMMVTRVVWRPIFAKLAVEKKTGDRTEKNAMSTIKATNTVYGLSLLSILLTGLTFVSLTIAGAPGVVVLIALTPVRVGGGPLRLGSQRNGRWS